MLHNNITNAPCEEVDVRQVEEKTANGTVLEPSLAVGNTVNGWL